MNSDQILLDMSASIARIEERVSSINITVRDVHTTVRGSNGDPGLVSKVDMLIEDIEKVQSMRLELDDLKSKVSLLRADHEALKRRLDQHPTYLWLLHNKTKETVAVSLVVLILVLLVLRPFFMGDLSDVFSRFSGLFLGFFGIK